MRAALFTMPLRLLYVTVILLSSWTYSASFVRFQRYPCAGKTRKGRHAAGADGPLPAGLLKEKPPSSTILAACYQAQMNGSNVCNVTTLDQTSLLAKPRGWLEYHPDGVYTVMRVDREGTDGEERIPQLDFHKKRLMDSYQVICPDATYMESAWNQTLCIMEALLQLHANNDDDKLAMMTILWHPSSTSTPSQPIVQGHFTTLPSLLAIKPVAICIATGNHHPSRQPHAHAKLSSWCTQRRPLEEQFLLQDISEVILTNHENRLLEGLTSNLFVVRRNDKDGNTRLQTAPTGILPGSARQLVLDAYDGELDWSAPCLQECRNDDWQEVFLTSAIKRIVPVDKVYVREDATLKLVWSAPNVEGSVISQLQRKLGCG